MVYLFLLTSGTKYSTPQGFQAFLHFTRSVTLLAIVSITGTMARLYLTVPHLALSYSKD